jgi:methyl-accepting chemotaxis protein
MLSAWKTAASHRSLALDALSARVMLADPEFRILYLNRSLTDFLKEAEPQLRQTWPGFSVEGLVGRKIDAFHQNPDHPRQMLTHVRGRHEASIDIGGRKFDLAVTPLRAGDRVSGYSVEWADAAHRLQNIDFSAQIAAFLRHQAVIVFAPDGAIIEANANFLKVVGYEAKEIVGRHHSLFVEPAVASGPDYRAFWEKLRAGQYLAGEFRRVVKGGREVWIRGSYNPIVDENGEVLKVVNFALEVTARVDAAPAGLAEGDLTQRLRDPLAPELDRLREDINRSVDTLNQKRLQRPLQRRSAAGGEPQRIHNRAQSDDRSDPWRRRERRYRPPRGGASGGGCAALQRDRQPNDSGDDRHRPIFQTDQPDHRRHR